MKRLIQLLSIAVATLLVATPGQAQDMGWDNVKNIPWDLEVMYALHYAAFVDNDRVAGFYLTNPEADGSTEYGDYCYYSYASAKGGTAKSSSSGSSASHQ